MTESMVDSTDGLMSKSILESSEGLMSKSMLESTDGLISEYNLNVDLRDTFSNGCLCIFNLHILWWTTQPREN